MEGPSMFLPTFMYFIKFIFLLIGIFFIALGVWDLRLGTNKGRYMTLIMIGAFIVILSQYFLQMLGVMSFMR